MNKWVLVSISIVLPFIAYALGGLVSLSALGILQMMTVQVDTARIHVRLILTACSVIVATGVIIVFSYTAPIKIRRNFDIGLHGFNKRYLIYAILLACGLLTINYAFDFLSMVLHVSMDNTRNAPSFGSSSVLQLIENITIAGLLTAWLEEVLFRGFMYGGLRVYFKPLGAAILSSIVFGLWHFDLTALPFLFLFGLSLCWLRQQSRSILPGVVVHALVNGVVIVFAYMRVLI